MAKPVGSMTISPGAPSGVAGLVLWGGPGRGLTPRPSDACGGGIVGRARNLAAGAGDVFR